MMRTALALCVVALTGCDLYFGNGGDDAPCVGGGGIVDGYVEYRDPSTGECVPDPYGGTCDDSCGPCPERGGAAPYITMGLCYSQCTGLAEGVCQGTSGCQASYENDSETDGPPAYTGCWQIAPTGPTYNTCATLDALECSAQDTCSMLYTETYGGKGRTFTACLPETEQPTYCAGDEGCGPNAYCDMTECYPPPGCDANCPTCGACPAVCYGVCVGYSPSCAAVDCAPGYHCEEQCYADSDPLQMDWCTTACVPDASSCALIDCGPGYECVESCALSSNGTYYCESTCIPSNNGDPGSCYGNVACDALPPACPSGTTPGIKDLCWTGYCIPNAACGPNDPGECYGDVNCFANPPACPTGTTAGVLNGCWTGYCIPDGQCAAPACATLSSEQACTARADCAPIYQGTNCECTANGCTCETLSYERCESVFFPF